MNWLKQWLKELFKKREIVFSDKYYTSIMDIPIWNWWQLNETNDPIHLLTDRKQSICAKAAQAFERLQDDFINHFGIDERFKHYMRLKCDIEIAYNKQILTGDKATTLLIQEMEARLKATFAGEKKSSYFTLIVALEKFLGRKLDIRKESTFDFYNYLNELKKWQNPKR